MAGSRLVKALTEGALTEGEALAREPLLRGAPSSTTPPLPYGGALSTRMLPAMQEPVRSHRQEGLKVLVRMEAQGSAGQPLGPWSLDVEQRSMEEVGRLPANTEIQHNPLQNTNTTYIH